jgi:hypothetical protein
MEWSSPQRVQSGTVKWTRLVPLRPAGQGGLCEREGQVAFTPGAGGHRVRCRHDGFLCRIRGHGGGRRPDLAPRSRRGRAHPLAPRPAPPVTVQTVASTAVTPTTTTARTERPALSHGRSTRSKKGRGTPRSVLQGPPRPWIRFAFATSCASDEPEDLGANAFSYLGSKWRRFMRTAGLEPCLYFACPQAPLIYERAGNTDLARERGELGGRKPPRLSDLVSVRRKLARVELGKETHH